MKPDSAEVRVASGFAFKVASAPAPHNFWLLRDHFSLIEVV